MLGFDGSTTTGNTHLESLVAELTSAVYLIALRHDDRESWADLELELWRAVMDTVRKWELNHPAECKKPQIRRRSSDSRDESVHIVQADLQA